MYKKIALIMLLLLIPLNVSAITKGTKVETVVFNKCVDGDTARFLRGANEIKVRFLAIDTPETVDPSKDVEEFGKEASDFTCEKLKNATKIQIEYDPKSDEKDKYDRYLGWIYVDDILLQDELVKLGYAKVAYIYSDYLYTDKLKESEENAKKEKLGIWSVTHKQESDDNKTEEKSKKKEESLIDKILSFFSKMLNSLMNFINGIVDKMLQS